MKLAVMPLIRNNKLAAALVAALIGVPALPAIAAPSTPTPPPPMRPAVLPQRIRLGRRWRHAAVRTLGSRRLRRLRERIGWSRPGGLNPRPRLPARESQARGPPPPRRRPRRPVHL